ncbi:hypothetical protein GALMADRAFT_71169, partial [Galerina marginata CBS 339.88]
MSNPEQYKSENLKAVKNYQTSNTEKYKSDHLTAVKKNQIKSATKFPPFSLSDKLQHLIISKFCNDTKPNKFEETGCSVCGKLTLLIDVLKLSDLNLNLDFLHQ